MLPPSRFALRWASADLAVAIAPSETYVQLMDRAQPASWWRALRRPALVLLVMGTVTAIAATGRVTVGLVASAMLLWTWVVAVQLAGGALMVASAPLRRLTVPAALDLFFASHLPWSLWVVGVGMWAASGVGFGLELAICIGLIASVWTAVILAAFNRTVLQTSRAGAQIRTAAHQVLIWFVGLSYVAWMAGGWFRLLP